MTTPVYRRRRPALLRGDRVVRRREYLETIGWLSAMGVVTLAVWAGLGREFALLGLGWSGRWQAYAGGIAAVAASVVLFLQARFVRRDPATREAARASLEPVREFVPRTREEVRLFRGVSLAAGIGEEIYYRGFLLWYLGQWMSLPPAVLLSSILFGAAHVMHGRDATARATVSGLLLAGLYLFTGSLWASMVLHAAIDLSSGEAGFAAFGDDEVASA